MKRSAKWGGITLCIGAALSPQTALAGNTAWFRMLAENGKQMGTVRQDVDSLPDGRRITETSTMRISEAGNVVKTITERKVRTEDAQGRTLTIETQSSAGRVTTRIKARIDGNMARIERSSRHGTRVQDVALPPGVRFDNGAGLLSAWNPAQTPRLDFLNFSLSNEGVERVTLELRPGFEHDPEGRLFVIRKSWDGERLRGVSSQILARNGTLLRNMQSVLGTTITLEGSPDDASRTPLRPVSIIRAVMVKSPFRITPEAMNGHVRYTFTPKEGLAFPVPQTGEQRMKMQDGKLVIDVCATCGIPQPLTDTERADALASTHWLESDAALFRQIGAEVRDSKLSDEDKMKRLAVRARQHMRKMDFSGHYTALEAFTSRSGDCTEEASVLAALGRAAGIPTRTAHGLVYSREAYHGISNVFMPHSWTLAWINGRWTSFDMSIGAFDATHIALTIGDGDARSVSSAGQLAALLEWTGMTQVKARKAE
ncbi:MAG TPA: transglutaminase-like domain-containing protein [Chakrabartia sp.]|nr:transglutaminase-like domain-containing protein [Chakrabartia sp.]